MTRLRYIARVQNKPLALYDSEVIYLLCCDVGGRGGRLLSKAAFLRAILQLVIVLCH